MTLKRLVDDLRDGQAVEIGLTPDRLNPATFDVEGDALRLLGRIGGLCEDGLALLPPGDDLLKNGYHADNHDIGERKLKTLLAGYSHRTTSIVIMHTRCTHNYTEVYNRCTQVYKGLFALAVALLKEAVGFLGHIFFQEVRVLGDDGFESIIEHDRGRIEIPMGVLDPLGGPDRAHDMRVKEFAG